MRGVESIRLGGGGVVQRSFSRDNNIRFSALTATAWPLCTVQLHSAESHVSPASSMVVRLIGTLLLMPMLLLLLLLRVVGMPVPRDPALCSRGAGTRCLQLPTGMPARLTFR
jgi:hypothetical protein